MMDYIRETEPIVFSGYNFKQKYGTIFYKILNHNMCHHDFQYVEGQNVDTKEFNPIGSCSPGGLYFTNLDHIYHFLNFGTKICEVVIEDDAIVSATQFLKEETTIKKFKANKITIKNIRSLYNCFLFDSEEKRIMAVSIDADTLCYIPFQFQTLKIQKIALKKNGLSIEHVPKYKQTKELCLLAVQQNGFAIRYISGCLLTKKEQEEIFEEAVKHKNGHDLSQIYYNARFLDIRQIW